MSCVFSVATYRNGRPVCFFTTDHRRARRFSRDSGLRFRRFRDSGQVTYGGGPGAEQQIAQAVCDMVNAEIGGGQ